MTSAHEVYEPRIHLKECTALAEAGYEVLLLVPSDGPVQGLQGVRVVTVPKAKSRRDRVLNTGRQLYRAALRIDPDVVHLHDPELLPWATLFRLQGRVVVYDMHENVPLQILDKAWIPARWRPLVSRAWSRIERVLLRGTPMVLAESSYARYYEWASQYAIVRNMPLVERLLCLEQSKHPVFTVGYMGGITPQRGCSTILDTLQLLESRGLDVRLECVGGADPAYRASLERHIAAQGVRGVTLHGYLPPEEGWAVIARCDVGIALLKPIPNYYESLPTKMFEYMALGLPVVVSDFPLYRSVVDDCQCGICVRPDRPEEAADALQYLAEHPETARAMGQRGRQGVITEYNWQTESEALLAFYRRLSDAMA